MTGNYCVHRKGLVWVCYLTCTTSWISCIFCSGSSPLITLCFIMGFPAIFFWQLCPEVVIYLKITINICLFRLLLPGKWTEHAFNTVWPTLCLRTQLVNSLFRLFASPTFNFLLIIQNNCGIFYNIISFSFPLNGKKNTPWKNKMALKYFISNNLFIIHWISCWLPCWIRFIMPCTGYVCCIEKLIAFDCFFF